MPRILLVSDNSAFATDLKQQFELSAGWEVLEEYSEGIVFDAVVVDDNWSVLRQLHGVLRQTPLFLLQSSDGEAWIDDGLCVVRKPFRLEKLLDDIHSGINVASSGSGVLQLNGCCLNPAAKEICYHSYETVKLTERETAILKYLYKANDRIVSKAELLAEVWGYNPEATTHTVETHIYRLRQKIEREKTIIQTEDNGYKIVMP